MSFRRVGSVLVIAGALLLPFSLGVGAAHHHAKVHASSLQRTMTVAKASRHVTIRLTSHDGGLNFDGKSAGTLLITVPKDWTVTVAFTNPGPLNHSAAVVPKANTNTLAFKGASTPNPTVGEAPGKTEHFTFKANRTGHYRIACLVPGHEDGGMWAKFDVVAKGQPTIKG